MKANIPPSFRLIMSLTIIISHTNVRNGTMASLGDFATNVPNKRKQMKKEWMRLSSEQQSILFTLKERDDIERLLTEKLIVEFSFEFEFQLQCFLTLLDDGGGPKLSHKFNSLYDFVEGQTSFSFDPKWETLFPVMFEKAIELENSDLLGELLSLAHFQDEDGTSKLGKPEENHDIFVRVCLLENFALVRQFIRFGYKIRSKEYEEYLSQMGRKVGFRQRIKNIWRWFTCRSKDTEPEEGEPEFAMYELHKLKAISSPAYILARYCEASDNFDYLNRDPKKMCNCIFDDDSTEAEVEIAHHCPISCRFSPVFECTLHVECNDPIYQCFDIANFVASKMNKSPDFRDIYEKINMRVSQLMVKLLEQCRNIKEVEIILEENCGAKKYFRSFFAKSAMKYPVLRLAIAHDHKEFAAHLFCQQILRQEWHGSIPWQNKYLPYKTVYFIGQTLLTPLHIIIQFIVEIGRDIHDSRELRGALSQSGVEEDDSDSESEGEEVLQEEDNNSSEKSSSLANK